MKHLEALKKKRTYIETQLQKTILIALFQEPDKINQRGLQKKTRISPRILINHLSTLKKQDLLNEEIDKNWKLNPNRDNRPRIYSLTSKGKKKCIQLIGSDIEQGLRFLERISAVLISDPSKLPEYIKEETESNECDLVTSTAPFSESVTKFSQREQDLFAPLTSISLSLHRILCLTLLQEKDYDSYVTVIEGNRRYIIPKERLIGIDFHSLAYLKLTQEKLEELQRGFKELFRGSPLSKEFQRSKAA